MQENLLKKCAAALGVHSASLAAKGKTKDKETYRLDSSFGGLRFFAAQVI